MARKGAGEKRPMDYALSVLSRRRISTGNLMELMSRKGFSEADAESCAAKLKEWGYLDDQDYAKDVLRAVMSECPVGRRRAGFELRKRAIDGSLAAQVLQEAFSGLDEENLAASAARKYLNGKDAGSLTLSERQRLARWLQRRGFGYEAIRSALRGAGQGDPEQDGAH